MDPTLNNSNYSYNGGGQSNPYMQFGGMTPQQRQMQMAQAYGLMNYNAPVNTAGSGAGQMGTSLMNGLLMNPSLQGFWNHSGSQQAPMNSTQQPMDIQPSVNMNNMSPNTSVTMPGQ